MEKLEFLSISEFELQEVRSLIFVLSSANKLFFENQKNGSIRKDYYFWKNLENTMQI